VFFIEELAPSSLYGHEALHVSVPCVYGGFGGFVVELVQFVPVWRAWAGVRGLSSLDAMVNLR